MSCCAFSLDDFYFGKPARYQLGDKVHRLCETRGVPGTHDTLLLLDTLAALSRAAPRMNLWTRPSPDDPAAGLAQGQLDLVIGPSGMLNLGDTLLSEALWEDDFVVVVRRGHPLARGKLTL